MLTICVDGFSVSQTYAIIVLPNGGPDLEAFTFTTGAKTCWAQAASLFWQVTRTLAEAEDLMHFEVGHSSSVLLIFSPTADDCAASRPTLGSNPGQDAPFRARATCYARPQGTYGP